MVKHIIYVTVFFLLSTLTFSQKAAKITTIKLKKEEMKEAKLLSDIIKEIPADCTISSYVQSVIVRGVEKTEKVNGGAIQPWLRGAYETTFFIDEIKSDCPSKHKKKYKIVVE